MDLMAVSCKYDYSLGGQHNSTQQILVELLLQYGIIDIIVQILSSPLNSFSCTYRFQFCSLFSVFSFQFLQITRNIFMDNVHNLTTIV